MDPPGAAHAATAGRFTVAQARSSGPGAGNFRAVTRPSRRAGPVLATKVIATRGGRYGSPEGGNEGRVTAAAVIGD